MLRLSLALCTLTMSVPGVTAAAQIDSGALAPEPAPAQPLNRSLLRRPVRPSHVPAFLSRRV